MRRLMWFTLGFTVSCVLGVYLLSELWLVALGAVGFVAAIALCFIKSSKSKILSLMILGFALGMVWQWGYELLYLQTARICDGKVMAVTVEVSDYSYSTEGGIAADGKLKLDGKEFRIRLYMDPGEELKPGDRVYGDFYLRLTAKGGIKEATYHHSQGIFLLGYARSEMTVNRAASIPGRYFSAKLRQGILGTLDSLFSEDTQGFVRALLLGDSTKLTYEEDTAFRVSGIRHVIAVSGLHVAILFALVYILSGKRRVMTALIGIPMLLLFAAVAGFTPSIVRACIMQILMILAMLLNREYDPPTALSFAVLTMLVMNPLSVTSVSLQLSALCMVGIFLFCGRINAFLVNVFPAQKANSIKAKLIKWFCGSISVTLSAMSLTTPLSALYFGAVSLVGVVTNLVALWIVSFVFYGIILALITGIIWLPLGKAVAAAVAWPVRYVMWTAKTLAALPLAAVYTCSVYILLWLVLCYALFVVFLLMKKKRPWQFVLCVAVGLCLAVGASYIEPRLDDLRVTVMNVGQGQSVLLQSSGKYYLVDCGGDDPEDAADVVAQQLLSQGITRLDGLFLTHYDIDHAGGVEYLMSRISVDKLYLPDISDNGGVKTSLCQSSGNKIQWVKKITKLSGDWGKLTAIPGNGEKDENESGLCILFQAENCDILITGDRGKTGERELLERIDLPELELLVVGHHGAASSTCLELLSVTEPGAAVISVGKNNGYGHPAEEVLDRLGLFGCRIWRTDRDGTVIFRR